MRLSREVSRRLEQLSADTILTVATLRFFAQAREATGTGSATMSGATVEEILNNAIATYGPALGAVIEISKVWVNGEEVPHSHAVGDKDEVAVLPPVSGGI